MNALEKRHAGTGLWFIGSRAFADWEQHSGSFLWLHGIPGCGKTVLSSTIIKHLENSARPAHATLYFFFDFNDKNKQTLENMLRALVVQLYLRQPDTREPLEQLWQSSRESGHQLTKMSLRDVLLAMLSKVNDVSIVIDALDESTTRQDLLAWLRTVLEVESISCRILVTGRREEDIAAALQRWMRPESSISIQERGVDEDVRTYVRYTVRTSEVLARWHLIPEVQEEIETELVKKAGGM